ncbi:TetR/AcrR family transcriptional regulator [Streptoverticillium reticulum]|uniref:TetR/AcrR family transcriptional regulator n=1 Tax=Streptoverticillium reticulum TaxID=1433415 RepID=UPI0039BF111F
MGSTTTPRRSNTRQRIQDVALKLFLEQGYEKTALREISDELGVTKAALYYHFKTKEDILVSLFLDLGRKMDELIAWGKRQPRELTVKQELLARCSVIFHDAAPLFDILIANQATLDALSVGQDFKDRVAALSDLLQEENSSLNARVRCATSLLTLHFGTFAIRQLDGDPEEKRLALLAGATELLTSAHEGVLSGVAGPSAGVPPEG